MKVKRNTWEGGREGVDLVMLSWQPPSALAIGLMGFCLKGYIGRPKFQNTFIIFYSYSILTHFLAITLSGKLEANEMEGIMRAVALKAIPVTMPGFSRRDYSSPKLPLATRWIFKSMGFETFTCYGIFQAATPLLCSHARRWRGIATTTPPGKFLLSLNYWNVPKGREKWPLPLIHSKGIFASQISVFHVGNWKGQKNPQIIPSPLYLSCACHISGHIQCVRRDAINIHVEAKQVLNLVSAWQGEFP